MNERRVKRKSKFLNCFLFLLIVFGLLAGTTYLYWQRWYTGGIVESSSDSTEVVQIVISEGANAQEIGSLLLEKGLIADLNLWKIYVKLNPLSLFAGSYSLPQNSSMEEIALILSKPAPKKGIWITIPEGKTREVTMEYFEKNLAGFSEGNFSIAEFDDITKNPDKHKFSADIQNFLDKYKPKDVSLEGFLYPETYSFETDYTAQDVVEAMLKQFMAEVESLDIKASEYEFYEALTLASIVEKESLGVDDRPYVASVFANRLEINMLLQSDATVNYALGKSERRPSYSDIKTDSPYNTYKYAGLPPTPINSPRLASIAASLDPVDSDYLYFIHEEDGTPHFGETLKEHNRNVCKYLDKSC